MSRTPAPWVLENTQGSTPEYYFDIYGKSGSFDVQTCMATSEADANFIVSAVNVHDVLIDALLNAEAYIETINPDAFQLGKVRAALKLAGVDVEADPSLQDSEV